MSRTTQPTLGGEILAALKQAFATVRNQMADPDPKVSLRAASELTKLVNVCARAKLVEPSDFDPIVPEQPTPPSSVRQKVATEPVKTAEPVPRPKPMSVLESIDPERWCDPILHHHPLPAVGPQLTSFLGKPSPGQKPPDRGKSV